MGKISGQHRVPTCSGTLTHTKQSLFLKARDTRAAPQESDLLAEKTAMSWLQGKLNVPRVVCFHEEGDTQYLLMTQITGVSGIHQDAKSDVPGLVRLFARGLREIHTIAVDSCPLDGAWNAILHGRQT